MADSEPKRLLKPPEQYSPLSKLKFACMTGDVEAVNSSRTRAVQFTA